MRDLTLLAQPVGTYGSSFVPVVWFLPPENICSCQGGVCSDDCYQPLKQKPDFLVHGTIWSKKFLNTAGMQVNAQEHSCLVVHLRHHAEVTAIQKTWVSNTVDKITNTQITKNL